MDPRPDGPAAADSDAAADERGVGAPGGGGAPVGGHPGGPVRDRAGNGADPAEPSRAAASGTGGGGPRGSGGYVAGRGSGTRDRFDAGEASDVVRAFLRRRGASAEDLDAVGAGPELVQLVLDLGVLPGARRYTAADLARLVGIEEPVLRRFWRAMGFPDVDAEERSFTDIDVAAMQGALRNVHHEDGVERAVQQTRVISAAMARVAEVWVDALLRHARHLNQRGADPAVAALALLETLDLDRIEPLLAYVHRRQLVAALHRRFTWAEGALPGEDRHLAVGFADLAGFTALSEQIGSEELAELIVRFESLTNDVIAAHGGRLVKTIGDEVMFVAPGEAAGGAIALDLLDATGADALLPALRIGLDAGAVLEREGDYFGPVVNRASRLVNLARRRHVLVPGSFRDSLRDDERFRFRPEGIRLIKDFGATWLWSLRRP